MRCKICGKQILEGKFCSKHDKKQTKLFKEVKK